MPSAAGPILLYLTQFSIPIAYRMAVYSGEELEGDVMLSGQASVYFSTEVGT